MEWFGFARQGNWPPVVGYLLFIGMMATGYYYNLTFVQLGLHDLGSRLIGMPEADVAAAMAGFALVTCVVALAFGWQMQRRGWSQQFFRKLRFAFWIALAQLVLTAFAPFLRSELLFVAWVILASVTIGMGVPVTFSLTVDLIPVRDRGYVGAIITSAAFFPAAVLASDWSIDLFALQVLPAMAFGTAILGLLTFRSFPFVERLAEQHAQARFGTGRFVRTDATGRTWVEKRLFLIVALMFAIFFIDSLGFLRIIFVPVYMARAWHAPDLETLLFIGGMHVLGAFIAGALYSNLDLKSIFLWIFGIFALMHLMYLLHAQTLPDAYAPLAMPMLYALVVSLYTVLTFAIWADLSTPQTISLNAAIGVALSGWTATFLSTALSLQWRLEEVPLAEHFGLIASLAMLFFLAVLASTLVQMWRAGEKASVG